jgi:hypothetical protein
VNGQEQGLEPDQQIRELQILQSWRNGKLVRRYRILDESGQPRPALFSSQRAAAIGYAYSDDELRAISTEKAKLFPHDRVAAAIGLADLAPYLDDAAI